MQPYYQSQGRNRTRRKKSGKRDALTVARGVAPVAANALKRSATAARQTATPLLQAGANSLKRTATNLAPPVQSVASQGAKRLGSDLIRTGRPLVQAGVQQGMKDLAGMTSGGQMQANALSQIKQPMQFNPEPMQTTGQRATQARDMQEVSDQMGSIADNAAALRGQMIAHGQPGRSPTQIADQMNGAMTSTAGGNHTMYDAGALSNAARSAVPKSRGVDEGMQSRLAAKYNSNSTDQFGITRSRTAGGGFRYNAAGSGPTDLPETAFGGANPGIASNNLARAAARGNVAPESNQYGTRTVDAQGRVKVEGTPMFGRQLPQGIKDQLIDEGFVEAPERTTASLLQSGAAKRRRETLTSREGSSDRYNAFQGRQDARQGQARDLLTQRGQQRAGAREQRIEQSRQPQEQMNPILQAAIRSDPRVAAGLFEAQQRGQIARSEIDLRRQQFQGGQGGRDATSALTKAQAGEINARTDLLKDPSMREEDQRNSQIDRAIAIDTPSSRKFADRLNRGQDESASGDLPFETQPDPQTGRLPPEQEDALVNELVYSRGLKGPELMQALIENGMSRFQAEQYASENSYGVVGGSIDALRNHTLFKHVPGLGLSDRDFRRNLNTPNALLGAARSRR